MTFDTWIVYVDDLRHHAQDVLKHVLALEDQGLGSWSRADRATVESLCQRMIDACPPHTLQTRPRDVMPFEWEDGPWAVLQARLQTVYDAASTRSNDTGRWVHELRVALQDYLEGWTWFDRHIER